MLAMQWILPGFRPQHDAMQHWTHEYSECAMLETLKNESVPCLETCTIYFYGPFSMATLNNQRVFFQAFDLPIKVAAKTQPWIDISHLNYGGSNPEKVRNAL